MAEIVFAIAAKVVDYLFDPVVRELRYCFCSDNIKRDFEIQRDLVTAKRESVEKQVAEARMRTEMIENDVENWMTQVSRLTQELNDLEDERAKIRGRFCVCSKYLIRKKMSMKAQEMRDLGHCRFEIFSRPAALPSIDQYFTSRNFEYFKSTKLAFEELMEALRDADTFMVGLYGMGGSGKTTLIKEVGKKAFELKLFDRVLFTTVSQTPDSRKIQGIIADLLGLPLNEESDTGRARRIFMRLRGGDCILLILDDVWGKLNLEDIGVHQGCKILLTTRLQTTCSLMNCQKTIPLGLLSEGESWNFFQHHAQIAHGRPSWLSEDVAKDIAEECKGLPIAIEAVGTTLKGKSSDEWNLALHKLRSSKPMDMEEGVRDAFSCLKLSYEYLRSTLAKSLFLMCGLFPEDHDIHIEDLFRYGMGLGLSEETALKIARSEVTAGINNLIASCLLTHSQKGKDYLKMHDIVRDVSLWIANNTKGKIMENPDSKALREAYAISSWYKEGIHFPHEFYAPNLEILLLNTRNKLDLSYTSFQSLKVLKVIAIINESDHNKLRVSLPQSAEASPLLPNLQTLRLVGLELNDISFIASLQELEILDLRASQFKELPKGIIELKNLKLLDLSWCELNENSCATISKLFTKLQEVYLLQDPRST